MPTTQSEDLDRHLLALTLPFSKMKDLLFSFKKCASFIVFPYMGKDIPEDIMISTVHVDELTQTVLIIAKHPSFPYVPEGASIPRKSINFSAAKLNIGDGDLVVITEEDIEKETMGENLGEF